MFPEVESEFPHIHEWRKIPAKLTLKLKANQFCQVCLLGRTQVPMAKRKGLESMEDGLGQLFRHVETHQLPELRHLQKAVGGKLYPVVKRSQ